MPALLRPGLATNNFEAEVGGETIKKSQTHLMITTSKKLKHVHLIQKGVHVRNNPVLGVPRSLVRALCCGP